MHPSPPASFQVETELPAIKTQIASMLQLLGAPSGEEAGLTPLPTAALATAVKSKPFPKLGAVEMEAAVREVLSRTLLPELVERQVGGGWVAGQNPLPENPRATASTS